MDEEYLQKMIKERSKSKRRELLMKILSLIERGDFDSSRSPKDDIFTSKPPRETYISPEDRDTYNSGYMEIGEMMASSPNVK